MKHRPLFFVTLAFLAIRLGAQDSPRPVAMVLSQPVAASEIEPRLDEMARQRAGLDSEAFSQWLLQARGKRLAAQVQKRLLDDYAKRFRLEPTEAELPPIPHPVEEAPAEMEESMKRVRQRRLAEIRKKLDAPGLDAAERARLTAERAQWEHFHTTRRELLEEERTMMSAVMQSWKVQQSLYQRYGGRVLLSSFGFHVAIDALLRFLREEEKQGSFEVHDPGLRAAFWAAAADETWADGVATGRAADELFATPPWQASARP